MKKSLTITTGLFLAVVAGGWNPFDRGPTLREVAAAYGDAFSEYFFSDIWDVNSYRNLQCTDAEDHVGKICTFELKCEINKNSIEWKRITGRFVKKSGGWEFVLGSSKSGLNDHLFLGERSSHA